MNEPTKEQIKELWEWCEVEVKTYVQQTASISEIRYKPDLDLNSLFRYAVQQGVERLQDIDLSTEIEAYYKLFDLWIKKAQERHHNSPNEEDLFWALYEVMKDE